MNINKLYVTVISGLFAVSCATAPSDNYTHIEGFVQGTTYSIIYSDTADHKAHIEALLQSFDNSLSIFSDSSLINSLNNNYTDSVDIWFSDCFDISSKVFKQSQGLFDPTVAPLIEAYGFARKNAARTLDSVELAAIMNTIGFDKLAIVNGKLIKHNEATKIDFNAIAQGYSVDLVSSELGRLGIENYMVEIGGEIYAQGVSSRGDKWRIGVDAPIDGNIVPGANIAAVIELSGRGLATSGNYRKFIDLPSGERVVHTIDPRTGRAASHNLLSATIIAPSAALADAYATICMVGGLEWAKKFIKSHKELDCILIYADSTGAMQALQIHNQTSINDSK